MLRSDRIGYALFAACAAVVFLASVVDPPSTVATELVPRLLGLPLDKWVHAVTYAGLAGLLCYATGDRTARTLFVVALLVATYGFAIEAVQATLPARSFEFADAAANTLGAALAVLAWRARLVLAGR